MMVCLLALVACNPERSPLAGGSLWEPGQVEGSDRDGWSRRYLGDVGIETDLAVVFVETFDRPSAEDFAGDWSMVENTPDKALLSEPAPHAADTIALEMRAISGQTSGAHLYHALPRNYEELYLRYYVKYAADGQYHHTGHDPSDPIGPRNRRRILSDGSFMLVFTQGLPRSG